MACGWLRPIDELQATSLSWQPKVMVVRGIASDSQEQPSINEKSVNGGAVPRQLMPAAIQKRRPGFKSRCEKSNFAVA
jgi:hypothetical protein